MNGRLIPSLFMIILTATLVGACAATDAGSTPGVDTAPTDARTDAGSAMTTVAVRADCVDRSEVDAVGDPTELRFECVQTATDPRLSGEAVVSVVEGLKGGDHHFQATSEMENENGRWLCRGATTVASRVVTQGTVCVGQDGYLGLVAYLQGAGTVSGNSWEWSQHGWIGPAEWDEGQTIE